MMKRVFIIFITVTSFLILISSAPNFAHAQEPFPTPTLTYEPLAEPVVPDNPTELELGRNWYWHNCMTCHGDVGQGLTDEFRAIWPEDHQNCWAHGCHGGRSDDEGFPIPTIVPALVSDAKLAQFTSQQQFFEFLKATHPPQDPGGLDDEQYQAIVQYVFSMNNRPLEAPAPIPTAIPTFTPRQEIELKIEGEKQHNLSIFIGTGIFLMIVVIAFVRKLSKN